MSAAIIPLNLLAKNRKYDPFRFKSFPMLTVFVSRLNLYRTTSLVDVPSQATRHVLYSTHLQEILPQQKCVREEHTPSCVVSGMLSCGEVLQESLTFPTQPSAALYICTQVYMNISLKQERTNKVMSHSVTKTEIVRDKVINLSN